jgi:hypothetical protein
MNIIEESVIVAVLLALVLLGIGVIGFRILSYSLGPEEAEAIRKVPDVRAPKKKRSIKDFLSRVRSRLVAAGTLLIFLLLKFISIFIGHGNSQPVDETYEGNQERAEKSLTKSR